MPSEHEQSLRELARDFLPRARTLAKLIRQEADAHNESAMSADGFQDHVNKQLPTPQKLLRDIAAQLEAIAAAVEGLRPAR
jgi:hypothetical protein